MKKSFKAMLIASQLLLGLGLGGCQTEAASSDDIYYPSDTWRTSTPESQGMDSKTLLKMFETIQTDQVPIHSVLILRHGYLVCEAYFQPFDKNTLHNLFSTTKSFTSTLIGIAIEEGKIKGVHESIVDIFPDVKMPENNLGSKEMTIEDLLTMTAGHESDSTDAVLGSTNWPQTFFNLPFSTKPGERFLYDSGASHLLASILKKATGENEETYARKHLFEPLGIDTYAWEKSTEGINTGGWGLRLTPTDMAKFGYLILNKGIWKGKQIVPAQWIEAATQKHSEYWPGGVRGDDYGYQFWMNSFGGFRADGFAGQYICILPKHDLIAVFTSGINYSEPNRPLNLMRDYVVPAVKSDAALQENSEVNNKLTAYLRELENPTPQVAPALPETAQRISGKTFQASALSVDFAFAFDEPDSCTLSFTQQGKKHSLPVGLDGVYRKSAVMRVGTLIWYPPYDSIALKGSWEGENTFILDWQYVGEPYHETYKFTFKENRAVMEVMEYVVGCAGPMEPYVKCEAIMRE